jgi:peptide/nickel transport system ATP-binding protein
MTDNVLEIRDLVVQFATPSGPLYAARGVDLDVPAGKIVGLVGETGSGKSVVCRAALGLTRAPGRVLSGSVQFDGADLLSINDSRLREIRGDGIGYIPQGVRASLNPVQRIRTQMGAVAKAHRNWDRREIRHRCAEALEAAELTNVDRILDAYPHQVSGGQAQRVLIAMALLLSPSLVIADEPTTGLDVSVQLEILQLLRERVVNENCAALLVTHDLAVVANFCDYVAVMYAGEIVEQGPVVDIFAAPRHPYTVGLLGSLPVAGQPLIPMLGNVPSVRSLAPGCAFAPRCSHVQPSHAEVAVPWRGSAEHTFRCHLPEGVLAMPTASAPLIDQEVLTP